MEYTPWIFQDGGAKSTDPESLVQCSGLTIPTGGLGFFSREECGEILRISQHIPARVAKTGDGFGSAITRRRKSNLVEVYPNPSTN